jgi:hypothetical protein
MTVLQMHVGASVFNKMHIALKTVYFLDQWTLSSRTAIICGSAKLFCVNDRFFYRKVWKLLTWVAGAAVGC